MVLVWNLKAVTPAHRPCRLIMSLDRGASPTQASWGETLLDSFGKLKLFFHLPLARQERLIGIAQFRFGAFLFADVRGGDHRECSPFRVLYLAGCDDHRQISPAGFGIIKFVARPALLFSLPD